MMKLGGGYENEAISRDLEKKYHWMNVIIKGPKPVTGLSCGVWEQPEFDSQR